MGLPPSLYDHFVPIPTSNPLERLARTADVDTGLADANERKERASCLSCASITWRRNRKRRFALADGRHLECGPMIPLSYRSPKTEVRASAIHGRGLFATAAIAKDEIVAVKGGHIID